MFKLNKIHTLLHLVSATEKLFNKIIRLLFCYLYFFLLMSEQYPHICKLDCQYLYNKIVQF